MRNRRAVYTVPVHGSTTQAAALCEHLSINRHGWSCSTPAYVHGRVMREPDLGCKPCVIRELIYTANHIIMRSRVFSMLLREVWTMFYVRRTFPAL